MNHVFAVDCQRQIPNPFVVVHLAARRARQLLRSDPPRVPTRSCAEHLIALEEIASGAVLVDELFAPLQLTRPDKDGPDKDHPDETELLAGLQQHRPAEVPAYAGKEM